MAPAAGHRGVSDRGALDLCPDLGAHVPVLTAGHLGITAIDGRKDGRKDGQKDGQKDDQKEDRAGDRVEDRAGDRVDDRVEAEATVVMPHLIR